MEMFPELKCQSPRPQTILLFSQDSFQSHIYLALMNILRYYTGQRQNYPYLFGAAVWLAWLISISFGSGNFDLGGQVIGTDYLMFYTAGSTLAAGDQGELYNFENQFERQVEIIGPEHEDFFAYINLPFLAWLYVPLSGLPYVWSFAIWCLIGLGLLWGSLALLGRPEAIFLSLTFFPVIANFTFGQNAFVSLFLLAAVYACWMADKKILTGVLLALLLYKPQLVMGVGFLWVLNFRQEWRALVGFVLGCGLVSGILFFTMPEAAAAYAVFAQEVLPTLSEWGEFPIVHMHHIRGFWQLLLPAALSEPLWIIGNLAGLFFFWRLWSQSQDRSDKPFWYAAATLLTLWTTPHAILYDLTLLLIPAVLLWHARPDWHNQLLAIYIWGWVAYMFSTPFTGAQLAFAPVAVQISVIFFVWCVYTVYQLAVQENSPQMQR